MWRFKKIQTSTATSWTLTTYTGNAILHDAHTCTQILNSTDDSFEVLPAVQLKEHAHTDKPAIPSSIHLGHRVKTRHRASIYSSQITTITKNRQQCMSAMNFTNGGLHCRVYHTSMCDWLGTEIVSWYKRLHIPLIKQWIVRELCFPSGVVLTLIRNRNHCQICSSAPTGDYWKNTQTPKKCVLLCFCQSVKEMRERERERVKNSSGRWKPQSKTSCALPFCLCLFILFHLDS